LILWRWVSYRDKVYVCGFPVGGDEISIPEGVVPPHSEDEIFSLLLVRVGCFAVLF